MDFLNRTLERIGDLATRRALPVVFAESDFGVNIRTPRRPLLELLLVSRGSILLEVADRSAEMRAGELAVMNAHFGNRGSERVAGSRYSCVSIRATGPLDFAPFRGGPVLEIVRFGDPEGIAALYREIAHWHHAAASPVRRLLLRASLLRLIGWTLLERSQSERRGRGESDAGPSLQRAMQVFEERWSDPTLDLADLAKAAGCSAGHLCRLFRLKLGTSPKHHLVQMRLRRARDLIERTDLPVKAVAYQCGFRDPLYFSRAFRAFAGVAPKSIR